MQRILICLLFIIIAANLFAQECEVRGTVVDPENQRIPGANILIKGTPNGFVTDREGEFLVRLPAGKTPLLFAYVDFKMLEQTFLFHKDSSYVLEVKMVPEKNKKRGSVSITSRSVITGR